MRGFTGDPASSRDDLDDCARDDFDLLSDGLWEDEDADGEALEDDGDDEPEDGDAVLDGPDCHA